MLNSSQKYILDTFIGKEGIYTATIIDYKGFDLGTKILYLQRAISNNCETLNQNIDTLYNHDLFYDLYTNNIEFLLPQ